MVGECSTIVLREEERTGLAHISALSEFVFDEILIAGRTPELMSAVEGNRVIFASVKGSVGDSLMVGRMMAAGVSLAVSSTISRSMVVSDRSGAGILTGHILVES